MWTGQQGRDRGLVDEYGGLEKAIELAKELAKIPSGSGVQRVVRPIPPTFFEELMSGGGDADETEARASLQKQQSLLEALPEDTRRALRYIRVFDNARNGEAIYMLPFDLRIK